MSFRAISHLVQMKSKFWIWLIVLALLTSCINRVGKVVFKDISLADSVFNGESEYYLIASKVCKVYAPKGHTIEFWSVKKLINPQYPDLGFVCDFYLGDSLYYSFNIDPMQLERDKNGSSKQVRNDFITTYRGRLNGFFISPVETTYTVKTSLFSTGNSSMRIKSISLDFRLK
jgi:hypothetical protein